MKYLSYRNSYLPNNLLRTIKTYFVTASWSSQRSWRGARMTHRYYYSNVVVFLFGCAACTIIYLTRQYFHVLSSRVADSEHNRTVAADRLASLEKSLQHQTYNRTRAAVCIVGAPRSFEAVADNIRTSVLRVTRNVDFFFLIRTNRGSQADTKGGKILSHENLTSSSIKRFSPVAVEYSNTSFRINDECPIDARTPNYDTKHTGQSEVERVWETMVGFKECIQLVRNQEVARDMMYGSVIRLRTDVVFFGALSPDLFSPTKPTLPAGRTPGPNDHLVFLPRHMASLYFDMADRYLYCVARDTCTQEKSLVGNILCGFSKTKTPLVSVKVDYTLVRHDGIDCSRSGRDGSPSFNKYDCNRCVRFAEKYGWKVSGGNRCNYYG